MPGMGMPRGPRPGGPRMTGAPRAPMGQPGPQPMTMMARPGMPPVPMGAQQVRPQQSFKYTPTARTSAYDHDGQTRNATCSHGNRWHSWSGHHGHGLRSWLTHGGARSSCHSWTSRARSSGHAHTWHSTRAGHSLLLWPSGLSSDLSRGKESLGLRNGWHEISSHTYLLHTTHLLHSHASHALNILTGQVCFTVLLPLSKGHIQRLGNDDSAIHLSHCLSSLLGGGEAHEPKSFGATFLVHDLGGSDGSVRSKFLPQSLIINSVIQILDIQVNTLISIQPLKLQLLKLLLQLLLSFSFLLSPANIQSLAKHFNTIEFFNSFLSRLRILEGHESESFVLSRFISHNHFVRCNLSELGKHFFEFLISQILSEVFDVNICEFLGLLSQLLLALLARNKSADEDFLLVQQHAIDLLDSVHGGFFRLEVNESVTLAASIRILSHLAGQDVSESREY